jgi:hypothetical protein
MEKEIVWTSVAQHDFWEIVSYLQASWPEKVLNRFQNALYLKTILIKRNPKIGFKSSEH